MRLLEDKKKFGVVPSFSLKKPTSRALKNDLRGVGEKLDVLGGRVVGFAGGSKTHCKGLGKLTFSYILFRYPQSASTDRGRAAGRKSWAPGRMQYQKNRIGGIPVPRCRNCGYPR